MEVEITPRASRRLTEIMRKDSNPSLLLRVTVESGGCHGFQYLMSLIDGSKVDKEEDTIFVAGSFGNADIGSGESWEAAGEGKAKVVMDEPSLELLKGSKIDYTMELIGSQFKIVDNPRASSSCGCGTSFDVKI
jgi:Fe-S cluster assembly iron-binding protein IscA